MNMNVQVLCPACGKCKKFEVEQETLWADDEPCEHLLYCKHLDICLNAVEIFNKQTPEQFCETVDRWVKEKQNERE